MFINFWYVAATSVEITDTPYSMQMLGQKFVLFRDSQKAVYCLSDICAHRGAGLSGGKQVNDCIECPYHGWQFNGSGKCTRIPSAGPAARIPGRAKVDSYPVIERYGLVHVFLGDLPESERPAIMEIAEWERDDWRFTNPVVYDWAINYMRSTENALDPAHAEFVHAPIFGNGGVDPDYALPPMDLIDEDDRIGCSYKTPIDYGKDKDPDKEPDYVTAGTIAYGPSHYVTSLDMSTYMSIRQYSYVTPIDERSERIFLLSGRNCNLEDKHDEEFDRVNGQVIEQDRKVLESVQPALNPESNSEEVLVEADGVIGLYRQRLQHWEQQGRRIDTHALAEQQRKGNKASAIPSPARNAEKGWVISPVPLR
jgi:phenylpropionate dioxygenase-like ring-hydroxylating dioxygenase large terminal subunit